LCHPVFQRVLLRRRQFAGAAFVAEIDQPTQPFLKATGTGDIGLARA
jgi:hypothetical protein